MPQPWQAELDDLGHLDDLTWLEVFVLTEAMTDPEVALLLDEDSPTAALRVRCLLDRERRVRRRALDDLMDRYPEHRMEIHEAWRARWTRLLTAMVGRRPR